MTAAPPLPVVVNRAGGAAGAASDTMETQLREAFAATGRAVAIHLVDPQDIASAIERHAGASRLVIGGGDGTLATAAHVVSARGGELAILPLGTRNHFARQLGIPLELAEAAALAVGGTASAVDLGDAGGRTFINNASVGAYPELVRRRKHLPLPKGLGSLIAGWQALARTNSHRLELRVEGETIAIDTPMLFVGNNRYEIDEGRPGERPCLTEGQLSVYALKPLTRWRMLRAALAMAIGDIRRQRAFAFESLVAELTIEGPGASIDIALDGEPVTLPLPLALTSRGRALKVVAGRSG